MKRHPAIGIGAPPDSPRAVSVMSSSLAARRRRRRTARRSPHAIKHQLVRVLPLSARYCCIIGVWAMLGRCVGGRAIDEAADDATEVAGANQLFSENRAFAMGSG